MVGKVRRSVAGGGRAPGAYRRRRRACRGPRSLRLWPGGGGRKARRGVGAIAEPWVGVDSSKPPGLARHAGATIGRGGGSLHSWRAAGLPLGATRGRVGGNFTHPRRPRRGLAEDGNICLPLVCRGGRIARMQLALAGFLSENEAMRREELAETRFFMPFAAHACIFSSSALLFCMDETHLLLHPKKTNSYANAILSEQSFHTRIYPLYTQLLKQNEQYTLLRPRHHCRCRQVPEVRRRYQPSAESFEKAAGKTSHLQLHCRPHRPGMRVALRLHRL